MPRYRLSSWSFGTSVFQGQSCRQVPVLHASHEGQFVQQSDADGDDLTYTNTHVGKTALPPRGALVTDDGVTINVTDIIANISCRNGSHRMGALM
jgi:hypothetical protein